ncbi:transglycosylase domain-containing protein [Myxococcus sp. K15C18031901]|uniref:transglycosylase domain-containing protein n=1 Tax=Myxococcus dinghuensis TaxID=2906761 RepID=UPI0020A7FF72|nr:transglycosylase domain-containing protein [Myxococcus dinghuensis]MCP3099853.1 transglycosylase domain-containing protein [Myxococcus dinghuensis]
MKPLLGAPHFETLGGSRLIGRAESYWGFKSRDLEGNPLRRSAHVALGIWFSRHWSAEQLATDALAQLSVGPRIEGVHDVSRALLGQEWADLSVADVALLAALHDLPHRRRNPTCGDNLEYIRGRRDWRLRELERACVLSQRELEAALRSPLVFAPTFSDWPPCPGAKPTSEEPGEAPVAR